ncbi:alpha/beta hydrolase [Sphingomonas sp. 2R-10]|uniref:alpha/beta hydrolase n=1 Tax=Sphingomonas sp. 2R-10 TaxID=3045148 RepID=UPI000F7B52C3|nr:alpha/beta hydrolase [Sphingomonas sp. 2R-10]MDJ0275569.1 alpha/beta hydrolase [Sphingomonas sp. 2R-10]
MPAIRHVLIALATVTAAVPALAAPTATLPLVISPTRSTTMVTWVPDKVRGVVLLSTGHGAWPERYDAAASAWRDAGFAVIAPVHVDSMHYPDRANFTMQASFMERIADQRAASGYAARTWPGKPVVAAGHSFGTLIALCLGGGLNHIAPFRDPSVKAVLGFSSPGRIPGLVTPTAYAADALPMMIVTGDADVVPGFVSDWHDHLFPVQSAPAGDKFAVTYRGGTHDLIGKAEGPGHAAAIANSVTFLQAYGLNDARARRALRAKRDDAVETWTRR